MENEDHSGKTQGTVRGGLLVNIFNLFLLKVNLRVEVDLYLLNGMTNSMKASEKDVPSVE